MNLLIFFSLFYVATIFPEMTIDTSKFAHEMHGGMKDMHNEMTSTAMTGNPDQDFAKLMIVHHKGALNMAKIELSYGKDPVMRRLAEKILVEQQAEIDAMNLWLKKQASEE